MVAIHAMEPGSHESMEHAPGVGAAPTSACSVPMHGMHHIVPPPAPVFTAGHADEQHLFQSAKAIVQHHFGPVMGATMPLGPPEPQAYPHARGTHEQVCDDPDLFQDTLRELYDALDIKVAKVMKLGGQELNLHLLYQRVTESGGALQVIRDKLWRDVGDAFHLPKTITSLSYVLKRGYMQYLWDYEQVYFHRKSGLPRVMPPASKYSKDQPNFVQQGGNTGGYQVAHPAMHMHAVDAAAAMAVAALRGRPEWTATALTHPSAPASYGAPIPSGSPVSHAPLPAASSHDPSLNGTSTAATSGGIPSPPGFNEDCKVPLANLSDSSAADASHPAKDAIMHGDSHAHHTESALTSVPDNSTPVADLHASSTEAVRSNAAAAVSVSHGNDAEPAPQQQVQAAQDITPSASPTPPVSLDASPTPWASALDPSVSIAQPVVPMMTSSAAAFHSVPTIPATFLSSLPPFSTVAPPQPLNHQMPPLPLAAVLQSHPVASLSSLVGKKGSVEAVSSAGAYGVLLTGAIEGQQFMGVLGCSSVTSSCATTPAARAAATISTTAAACNLVTAQSGGVGNEGSDMEYELQAPKRPRTSSEAPHSTQSSSKHLQMPDTIESLLSRLGVVSEFGDELLEKGATTRPCGTNSLPRLKAVPGSSDRAVAVWQQLDSHKRSMIQNAVRADEERYRAEVCLRDAQIAVEAAQQRRDSALRAASDTLTMVGDFSVNESERADSRSKRSQSSMAPTAFNGNHLQYMSPPSDNADTLAQGFADMYFPDHSAAESSGRMHHMHHETHYMWQPYIGRPCEPHHDNRSHHLDKMSASDDPLMCAVAPTGRTLPMLPQAFHPHQLPMMPPGSCPTMPPPPHGHHAFTGGFPYVTSNPGGQTAAKRAHESVKDPLRRGPRASPNTHSSLLPTNRHMAYPKAPDHLVQPMQPLTALPESESTAAHGMDAADQGLADCMDLPLSHGLGDFPLEDALIGAGELEEMLGLGDDFMLEDPV